MTIIAYIATILLMFILPLLFIIAMIKPNKFRRFFRKGKVTRLKILGRILLIGIILFVIVGFTAPPEAEASKLARQAESTKIAEINRIKSLENDQIKKVAGSTKSEKFIDEQNSKLASTIDLHNSKIKTENDNKTIYNIVPNSYNYDTQIELLDANKKVINSTRLNHANHNWAITADKKPEYDNGVVKYLTYSVSVGGKYYNSNKVLDISKDYVNYPKIASSIDLHNSNIRVESPNEVIYGIIPNSYKYDVHINLLDANTKTIATADLNHSNNKWSIMTNNNPVYDSGTVKYLTYSVSVNNKYYNSGKTLDISKDYKNYSKLADSIKITNTKITKKDGKFVYSISSNSKVYDVRLDFVNSNNQVLLSKSFNHADKIWDVASTESPISSGGKINSIKTYISIDSNYYNSTQQIDVNTVSYVDQDLINETARQAEIARQAESASKAAADAVAAKQVQQESQPSQSVYYKNCDAVRAAGAAPIYEGQPGYRSKLDRDSDGVACE